MAGLSGKKLEDDLSSNNLKKCCGISDHFKYDCGVRYDTHFVNYKCASLFVI